MKTLDMAENIAQVLSVGHNQKAQTPILSSAGFERRYDREKTARQMR